MRTGAWLWLPVALAFSGCQSDYPLEPTACDRYCHATKDLLCDFYDPSGCVLRCERDDKDDPACGAQFEANIACFEATPAAAEQFCSFSSDGTAGALCAEELSALSTCLSAVLGYDGSL